MFKGTSVSDQVHYGDLSLILFIWQCRFQQRLEYHFLEGCEEGPAREREPGEKEKRKTKKESFAFDSR